ncbi:acetoin reductase family protein [Mycena vitilis]|nr:acetoin reductase family protein [Mycena vitilis]
MSFKGIAIVTGAAQGIGRGIALRLASDGFDIAVNDITSNADKLAELVEEIKAKGRQASAHVADVSVDLQVKGMVEEVVRTHGGLDAMIANAGVMNFASIEHTSVDDWDRVMAINARGTFLCYKYAGMQMISQGRGGRIIGACSLGGKKGGQMMSAYCASKFAIRGLTQSAASEYGPHGITVNSYAPGMTDTEMGKSYVIGISFDNDIICSDQHGQIVCRPNGKTPDDIVGLVSFIASKESQFITGAELISINGGMYFD